MADKGPIVAVGEVVDKDHVVLVSRQLSIAIPIPLLLLRPCRRGGVTGAAAQRAGGGAGYHS